MHFAIGIYFFTIFLVSIRCQEQIPQTDKIAHNFSVIGNCFDTEMRKQISNNKLNVGVRPHNTHVTLNPIEGYEFDPNVVIASQCSGHCRGGRAPMPTRFNTLLLVVNRYPVGQPGSAQCGTVEVKNHTMCKCLCKKSTSDCPETQELDEESCDCRCKDSITKTTCLQQYQTMDWDPKDCSCRCKDQLTKCMTGLRWDPIKCRCVRD